LLGKGPINKHSWQQKRVFSVRSVPRNYKRAQSGELKKYKIVRRSTKEYNGVQLEIRIFLVECPVGR
jgi:hypothetical protein